LVSSTVESVRRETEGEGSKPSIQSLEESYKELKSRNIKGTLSSFLLDMPGEQEVGVAGEEA